MDAARELFADRSNTVNHGSRRGPMRCDVGQTVSFGVSQYSILHHRDRGTRDAALAQHFRGCVVDFLTDLDRKRICFLFRGVRGRGY